MTPTVAILPFGLSLTRLFLAACLAVMFGAMIIVGKWVETRIETAVVQNAGNAAAIYMESFISPLSQDLAEADTLSEPAERALVEIFNTTPLGERILGYRIWKPGGLVVHASDAGMIGQTVEVSAAQAEAWDGRIGAQLGGRPHEETGAPATRVGPRLEVYSPIRALWSDDVIAVAEFYLRSDRMLRDMSEARRQSWIIVGSVFSVATFLLIWIVRLGDRLIGAQARELEARVRQSEAMAAMNRDLRARVVEASARATAETDRFLRRLGSDLHDGPAQHIALAALRLDAATDRGTAPTSEVEDVRAALSAAMGEIRRLSRGLMAPDIDNLSVEEIVQRVVAANRGGGAPTTVISSDCHRRAEPRLGHSARLCIYRFLQEALSNVTRHAPGSTCAITCDVQGAELLVSVEDDGPGFDPARDMGLRDDGGQGLWGLRDRAESLGGQLDIHSAPGQGTVLVLHLPLDEETKT